MNGKLGPKILALRKAGATYNEITKKLRCSRGTVSYHCQKHGLGGIENETTKAVLKLNREGKSREEIQKLLNVSARTVRYYLQEAQPKKCAQCGKIIRTGKKYCCRECWIQNTKEKAWKRYEKNLSKLKRICAHRMREYFASKGITVCQDCGQGEDWNGHKLILQIHHIDKDKKNNKIENLVLLCPNCHIIRHSEGVV